MQGNLLPLELWVHRRRRPDRVAPELRRDEEPSAEPREERAEVLPAAEPHDVVGVHQEDPEKTNLSVGIQERGLGNPALHHMTPCDAYFEL